MKYAYFGLICIGILPMSAGLEGRLLLLIMQLLKR